MLNPLQLAAQNFVQEMGAQVMRGFNGRYGQNYMPTQRAIAHEMEEYFERVKRGEETLPPAMTEYVMTVATEACKAMLGEGGETEEEHIYYKKCLDSLKNESMVDKQKQIIDEHFDGLTEKETKVLLEIARDMSHKQHAKNIGMTEEEFMANKHGLIHKFKKQHTK